MYQNTDKFGNPMRVIGCKPNKRNPDFCVGYLEIGGTLYKLEPSMSKKEGVSMWVRVTKMVNRNRGGSFGSTGSAPRRGL